MVIPLSAVLFLKNKGCLFLSYSVKLAGNYYLFDLFGGYL